MKTIPSLIPGSPAWLKSRSASKAPAMMGCDSKTSRSALLKMMATGIGKEFSDWQQKNLLEKGQISEIGARDIAEGILNDSLAPICCATDDDYLTAAPDGATFSGDVGFEAKLWNEELAAAVRAGEIPDEKRWQLDQQILVCGFEYVLFMVTDGTCEKCVHMEYRSTPERAAKLLAGWKQFDEDLANYQHVEAPPEVVAAPIADLPALMVEISGSVTASNLEQWRDVVTARIAGINTDLQTDQDFADADSMVKFLDDGEKRIELVKSQAQANAADIDRVFRALDEIKASMRSKRLELDKLVTKRKESIKIEIMQAGKDALNTHITSLNKRLAKVQMPPIAADFAAAIKGKRNLEAMRGAVADLVAAKKLDSNEIADRIDANLRTLAAEVEHQFLFADIATLAMKAPDDLALVIKSRIQDHVIAEEKRIAAEREKIRAEEEAKAAAKVKAEQEEAARQERLAQQARDDVERQRMATETAAQPVQSNLVQAPSGGQPQAPAALAAHTEPAHLPAPAEAIDSRLDETEGVAAHKGITGSARLMDRLDDLARQMTERQLSDLCVHAEHILSEGRKAA